MDVVKRFRQEEYDIAFWVNTNDSRAFQHERSEVFFNESETPFNCIEPTIRPKALRKISYQ